MQPNAAAALRLWSWITAALAVLAISIACTVALSARCTSITTQLSGSLLTFFGFLFAYLRASHRGHTLREQLRDFLLRLVGRQRTDVSGAVAAAAVNLRFSAYAEVPLNDRSELELQEQIDRLAAYIRTQMMPNFKVIFERLDQLKVDVERAHAAAAEKASDAYNRSMAELEDLRRDLDRTQVLDLRWAIFGIYIVVIGVVLSYWS